METQQSVKYRDGDYDADGDPDEVASNPEGVKEASQFVPLLRPRRHRSSSLSDIARYSRYFNLIEKNHASVGTLFTWSHYLSILHDELRLSDAVRRCLAQQQMAMTQSCDDVANNNVTPRATRTTPLRSSKTRTFSYKRLFGNSKPVPSGNSSGDDTSVASFKRSISGGRIFRRPSSSGSETASYLTPTASLRGGPSPLSSPLLPQASLMRKVCQETKILARKICKTVEKISALPHKCASCGAALEAARHKDCLRGREIEPAAEGDMASTRSPFRIATGQEMAKNSPRSNHTNLKKTVLSSRNTPTQLDKGKESSWGAAGESVPTLKKIHRKKKKSAIVEFL